MSIYENTVHLDPKFDYLTQYRQIAWDCQWTPGKYQRDIEKRDVPHIKNNSPEKDRICIERCILSVLLVEDKIKRYWGGVVPVDFPQTVITDVAGLFGAMEVVHRVSYSHLGTSLGVDLEQAKNTKQLNARIKYLDKYLEEDPKIIGQKRKLKRLVLFTALVERISLFTQFYILMSWCKRNKGLKTISALQQSTGIEELLHYKFGLELISLIKQEKPQLWDDYLVDLINKNVKMAHKAELKLIDWFFENGMPDHLTREEVVNFLNFNFQQVSDDLDLGLTFKYDKQLYEDRNAWLMVKLMSQEVDFFDAPVGGYSLDNEEVDLDEIFG